MKRLYLVKMKNHRGYDTYSGHVVRAESENAAREFIARDVFPRKFGDEGRDVWLDPELSFCEELSADGNEEALLSSFHAG